MPETNEKEPLPVLQPEENDILSKIFVVEKAIINCPYLHSHQREKLLDLTLRQKEMIMAGGVLRMAKDKTYKIIIAGEPVYYLPPAPAEEKEPTIAELKAKQVNKFPRRILEEIAGEDGTI